MVVECGQMTTGDLSKNDFLSLEATLSRSMGEKMDGRQMQEQVAEVASTVPLRSLPVIWKENVSAMRIHSTPWRRTHHP